MTLPTRTVILKIKADNHIDWERSPVTPEWLRVKVVNDADTRHGEARDGQAVRIQITPVSSKRHTTSKVVRQH